VFYFEEAEDQNLTNKNGPLSILCGALQSGRATTQSPFLISTS
jgi:hypothetical protein